VRHLRRMVRALLEALLQVQQLVEAMMITEVQHKVGLPLRGGFLRWILLCPLKPKHLDEKFRQVLSPMDMDTTGGLVEILGC